MTRTTLRKKRSMVFRWLRAVFLILLISSAALGLAGYELYGYIEAQLPDIEVLADIRYQIPMNVFSRDGLLIAQYGEKKRNPIAIAEVPKRVTQAFLAAEDNRFFDHPGVDYQGLARAAFSFLRTGEKKQGGSTITMQVARNFFLTKEKTFFRKIKEIMLAIKIESKLPKERILELYLNKIYFGHHAYGIVAAAQVYYGKTVDELDLGEIAMIAGLPKAPSAFNPIANPERALTRRDYVLRRMRKLGYIDDAEYQQAAAEPITASLHTRPVELDVPYIAELVRSEMYDQLGEDAYVNGYQVYTTIDSRLQLLAEKTLRLGLHGYDERHGYRGTKQHIDLKKVKTPEEWDEQLSPLGRIGETVPGLAVAVKDATADIYLGGGRHAELDWRGVRWGRRHINENREGPFPRKIKDVIKPGDIIRVRRDPENHWMLSQVPEVAGALVSVDPKTGSILAVAGGYDFGVSKFNRVTQAQRQPGSGFKPILYAAALSEGYTPSSVVNDAPIAYADPSQSGGVWRPKNYSGRSYGPTRLRVALAKSRNLVSIRLLKSIGLNKAIETAIDFGFLSEELPRSLPLALGTGSATPLRMAQAYAVFANGGFRVDPYLIDRIETDFGKVVFQSTPPTACLECPEAAGGHYRPENLAQRVISPQVHFMMNSMLQDVIRMGTATRAQELGRSDLGGKTGTTNDYKDAWFNGYTPSLVTVAWLGFDSSKSLGEGETGGHAALPIWINFMREALKGVPEFSFQLPTGLTTARIDPYTGTRVSAANPNGIFEVSPSGQSERSDEVKRLRKKRLPSPEETAEEPSEAAPPVVMPQRKAAPVEKPLESLF